jgi:hypothetical protein
VADKERPHAGKVADLLGSAAGAASARAGDPRYIAADDREFITMAAEDAANIRATLPAYAQMMGCTEAEVVQRVPGMVPVGVLLRFMDLIQLVPPEALDAPTVPPIAPKPGRLDMADIVNRLDRTLNMIEAMGVRIGEAHARAAIVLFDPATAVNAMVVSASPAEQVRDALVALCAEPSAIDGQTDGRGGFTPGTIREP